MVEDVFVAFCMFFVYYAPVMLFIIYSHLSNQIYTLLTIVFTLPTQYPVTCPLPEKLAAIGPLFAILTFESKFRTE